jgi:transposase
MGTARNAEVLVTEQSAKRRYRSKRDRRQIVEETLQPGASVAVIARRHDVNANQVFHWRKLYREGGSMWNQRRRNCCRCGSPK